MYVYLFTTNQNSTIHCPCFLNHLKWTWQDLDYYAPSSKLLLTSHSAINCQLKQILMLSFESQKDFFGFLVCLPFITKGSLIWLWNHINLCCSYLQLHNGWIFAHVVFTQVGGVDLTCWGWDGTVRKELLCISNRRIILL